MLLFLYPASLQIVSGQTTNGVLREFYAGIGNGSLQAFTNSPSFPASPTSEFIETAFFEAPSSIAENYGQRMRALLSPPVTGNYVFYIATDDQGALFLSSDESPNNRMQIAIVPTWVGSRAWNDTRDPANVSQKSASIFLSAGNRYYIEALQTEGGGGDNLAVAWQKPGDPIPANGSDPIPGAFLVPYGLAPPVITTQPTNITVIEGNNATFTVQLARMLGATFQWSRNGTNIPGATFNSYSFGPVTLADTSNRFRCFIANSLGTTNSNEAILTVVADTTKPTLATVGNIGENQIVFVVFSEPVEVASATDAENYTINNGVSVTRATFGVDSRTIILTTTLLSPNVTYTLTVNNVRDRASTPNTILTNSTKSFSLTSTPLDVSFLSLPKEPLGPSSRRHGVVISEVMYHPTNRADGRNLEFIEIFNSQAWFEEIGGWRISGAIDYTFPSNTILQPRSFLVVAAVPADLQAVYGLTGVLGPFANTNGLQNSSGTLRLRNARDAVLFEMNYSGDPPYPVAADGGGHSLVLARPSYGEGDPRAWAASDIIGGTPRTNEVAGANPFRTILVNEFLAHTDPPQEDYIELYNYGTASVNIGRCVLTDNPETNKFIIPTNTILPARGFVAFTQTQLGFALSAAGEDIFLKNTNGTRIIDAVRFGAQENGVATGRYADGAPSFTRLARPTPGTNNAPFKTKDVVINEIMFDPVSGDSDDEYVELFNRSTNLVNLGGWRIRDAVSFTIPANTFLPAGGYLVIARNAARLRTNYAGLTAGNCLGNFSGSLANGGERVALNFPDEITGTNQFGQLETNTIHITSDEVTYATGGRWGTYSAGGGSSLELEDARADSRLAPNWADSDESAKSGWVTVQTTGVMDNGWADAYQLHVTLQGAGEALLDDVEVIPAGSTNVIGNGTFESGAGGWTFQGNHNQTSWEPGEGYNSTRALHLRATGRGDSGANRVRTQLPYTLAPGTTVTLRAKVRWLKGNPSILLRLRGNWLEAPGYILTAHNLGSPGAQNSRAVANAGPAIIDVRHSPTLPAAGQTVLITTRVNDPDGLAFLSVNYRLDPSTNYITVAMTNNGAGLYSVSIPGQTGGASAAFYIQASDNFLTPASARFPNDAPARECLVRWGDSTIPGNGTLGTYRFWLSQTNVSRWSLEEKMSNNPKDVTFIYGTNRIIYNAGAWFHGSPYHSPGYDSPVGAGCDYDMNFPPDDRFLGDTDINLFRPGNGGGDGTAQTEIHGYWFGGQFGAPFLYHRP
ncbi:MAG TPA: lamin tail domain-containing protein, partial [Verrucomicrobiae bacterium]